MEDPVSTDLDLDLPLLTRTGELSLFPDAPPGGSCEERSLSEARCRILPSRVGPAGVGKLKGGRSLREGGGGVLER